MGFPINWNQQASDNLTRIARMSVRHARRSPGTRINPFGNKLAGTISFDDTLGLFDIDGRLRRNEGIEGDDQAIYWLIEEWGHELYLDPPNGVDVVTAINGPLGHMAAEFAKGIPTI